MFFYFFSIRFYGGMICCAYILQVLPFRTAFTLLYIRNRSIMNYALPSLKGGLQWLLTPQNIFTNIILVYLA